MCPISGGNWNDGSAGGVWALNLNNTRTNSNDNVGFRADSYSPRIWKQNGGAEGDVFQPLAKSEWSPISGSENERHGRY